MSMEVFQPRMFVQKRNSKERTAQRSLSEALKDLDLCTAARDLHRQHYVFRFLEQLASNFLKLSGTGQKSVVNLLQVVVDNTLKTGNDVAKVRSLLTKYKVALDDTSGHTGRVGSRGLWKTLAATLERLRDETDRHQLVKREDDGDLLMSHLPDDCLRHLLRRLSDHTDIINLGLTCERLFDLAREDRLWSRLCAYHFSQAQIDSVTSESTNRVRWLPVYYKLLKKFGQRDAFYEMLYLCGVCEGVYWQHHGHQCVSTDSRPDPTPVSPVTLVGYFVTPPHSGVGYLLS